MGSDPLAGFVYGIVHPAFPGFIKIGKTKRPRSRLNQYNTGDPTRSYTYAFTLAVPDMHLAELQAHRRLDGCRVPGTEWFFMSPEDALGLLTSLTYEETA